MKAQLPQHEHEFEAAPGLPEPLPPGERLLWQGTPDWRVLAVEALHVRKVAIYFGVLTVWRVAIVAGDGAGLLATTKAALWMLLLAGAAIGLLSAVAWFMARNSLYTITDKRVVMRVGVVLSVTFNLPFKAIAAAALRRGAGGHGDISLALAGPDRIAYLHLWPHARPWQIKQPQPMMRALPQAQAVAAFLAAELAQSAEQTPIAVSVPHRPRQTTQTPGFDRLGPSGMESPMGVTS